METRHVCVLGCALLFPHLKSLKKDPHHQQTKWKLPVWDFPPFEPNIDHPGEPDTIVFGEISLIGRPATAICLSEELKVYDLDGKIFPMHIPG